MGVAWPEGVPFDVLAAGFEEGPEANVAEFAPEVGPPKRRRRSSIATDSLSFEMVMTTVQWETLLAWFRGDLADGALAFAAPDDAPIEAGDYQFVAPPRAHYFTPLERRVPVTLRRMP